MDREEKLRLRREKLERWKMKRGEAAAETLAAPVVAPAAVPPPVPAPRLSMAFAKRKTTAVFDNPSDDELPPAALAPLPSSLPAQPVDATDLLDAFMSTMVSAPPPQDSSTTPPHSPTTTPPPSPSSLLATLSKRRKIVPAVDHTAIDYPPFARSFYTPPPELSALLDADVTALRVQLDGIRVKGRDPPRPILSWSQLALPLAMEELITANNYASPTPIQAQALPAALLGRDVLGIAKTGSGKTMAYVLPLFRHIAPQPPLAPNDGPLAMVLVPTRELATQVAKACKPLAKLLNLTCVSCYGGSPIAAQIAALRRGAHVVVCTPGRMIDLLAANGGRVTNLRRTTFLVLDEADRMFDMGFEPQIQAVVSSIRPDRQTLLFLATFPPKMEQLARKALTNAVTITVGGASVVNHDVEQVAVVVEQQSDKLPVLLRELGRLAEGSQALVFVDRQESADALAHQLAGRGHSAVSTHGGKAQMDRDGALSDFHHKRFDVLVATSVAARGLDVPGLALVVNYDAPSHMEDYVHRVGRTGRAGNKGRAVTVLLAGQERQASDVARAMEMAGVEVPEEVLAMAKGYEGRVRGGYGGKGLDRLDKQREVEGRLERQVRGEGVNPEATPKETPSVESTPAVALLEATFQGAGDASSATLPVNDIPHRARVHVSQQFRRIAEETGAAVMIKGRYVPSGAAAEDPLHVLVEGGERSVAAAVAELRQALIEGLQLPEEESKGRYKVV